MSHRAQLTSSPMRATLERGANAPRPGGGLEVLLGKLFPTVPKRSVALRIEQFCRAAQLFLRATAVGYWELTTDGEPKMRHARGPRKFQILIEGLGRKEPGRLVRAMRGRQPVIRRGFALEDASEDRAYLMVPVKPARGRPGIFVLLFCPSPDSRAKRAETRPLGKLTVRKAGELAAWFEDISGSTAAKRTGYRERGPRRDRDLINFSVEIKPSLRLTEFVERFTLRAAQMLGARLAFLALTRGRSLETVYAYDPGERARAVAHPEVDRILTKLTARHSGAVLAGDAARLVGKTQAKALGWENICVVRLAGRDGEPLGALCLVDRARDFSQTDHNLMRALADHASVALENSRLFSRIEQSKRQWVEDFDAITDLIVVHDPGYRILRVNRSLAEALGCRPSELVGMHVETLRPIAGQRTDKACPFCSELPSSALTEDTVLHAGARAFLISTSRIGSSSDENSRTIHILKDITEQRSYQIQLQRERDFNTKILNHTHSMILVLDTAGLVSYANRRCYEAGYRKESLLGRPLGDFIPAEHRAALEKAFEIALHGSPTENLELPVLRGNRSTGRYAVNLSPMRDEEGHVNSIVVVMTDITDAAVLQTQLRHSEKMAALGQLVSGVAHEINNPLAAIVGYADLLTENPSLPHAAKEELHIILEEAERTRAIVQNLLQFARQMPPRREKLDVQTILHQTLQLRSYGSASEGVEVVEHHTASLPQIFADGHQLQQVFLNILNNAYDAVRGTGRPGRIEIATVESSGFVEISIRDNGSGIADTERIFEPFYTTKEVGKGTGLGLSICYGILREHGGDVLCGNNTDSHGCTFRVRLPAAEAAKAAPLAEGR